MSERIVIYIQAEDKPSCLDLMSRIDIIDKGLILEKSSFYDSVSKVLEIDISVKRAPKEPYDFFKS